VKILSVISVLSVPCGKKKEINHKEHKELHKEQKEKTKINKTI